MPFASSSRAEAPDDALNALKAVVARNAQTDPGPNSRFLFTDPNSLALQMAANQPAPGVLAAKEDLQRSYVSPDQRQRDEILNEKGAANDADAQFGDQMAARALKHAVASKLGLANAEDESQLTQAHEQVLRNKGDEAMRLEQPKLDAQRDVQNIKSNADLAKADAANALATGKISQAEYNAYVAAQAKVYGSPFAAQGANLAPPPPVVAPPTMAGVRGAVATRTGSTDGPRAFSTGQQGLIARYLQKFPNETRADAVAFYDRTKPQGWE